MTLSTANAVARLSGKAALGRGLPYFVGLSVLETTAAMWCSEDTVESTLASHETWRIVQDKAARCAHA